MVETHSKNEIDLEKPPRVGGNLLIGSLTDFQRNPLTFLENAAAKHGDFVHLRFAYINAYFVNHPNYIEEILLRSAEHFDKDTRSAAKIRSTCGNSLLSGDHATWARHRALVQPVFQPRFINATGPAIDRQLAAMIERWDRFAIDNHPIDLVAEVMTLVMNMTVDVLFGDVINVGQLQQDLAVLISDTWQRIGAVIDPSALSPLFHKAAFKQALKSVDATAFSIIAKRRASHDNRDDLLGRLLESHAGAEIAGLDDRELRDAAVTLLLSGHETTASAITWALYHIAVANNDRLSNVNPAQIFKEAIRLYPSIWIIERRAIQDIRIGPYIIPKGSMVLISPYHLHRHPAFWLEAEQFDPGRFDDERVKARPRNAYLPFGLGQHRCIGLHLTNLIAERTIAAITARFKIVLQAGPKPLPMPMITLGIAQPIWGRLERRETSIAKSIK